jgi:hypothetical protein
LWQYGCTMLVMVTLLAIALTVKHWEILAIVVLGCAVSLAFRQDRQHLPTQAACRLVLAGQAVRPSR